MIRVTVELVPFGREEQKKTIGIMNIANVTGRGNMCDYEARLEDDRDTAKTAVVTNFMRSDGVWRLIRRALTAMSF